MDKSYLRFLAKESYLIASIRQSSCEALDLQIELSLKTLIDRLCRTSEFLLGVYSPMKHEPKCFRDLNWWKSHQLALPTQNWGWKKLNGNADLLNAWPQKSSIMLTNEVSAESLNEKKVVPTILIVPGLLFDQSGGRLGLGKGWYDRTLKPKEGLKIGVIYEEFLRKKLPLDFFDQRVDWIVTEKNIIQCAQ